MAKPIIAIDVDDVLAISAPCFLEYNNALWGGNAKMEDYTEDWMSLWRVSEWQLEEYNLDLVKHQKIYPTMKPVKNAKTTLAKLSEKYDFVVLTSRPGCFAEMTEKWLEKHFRDVIKTTHFAGFWDDVSEDSVRHTKGKIVRELGAKCLIDDQPKHCFSAREHGIKSILFGEYSWNRDVKNAAGMHRAKNWQQVHELLWSEDFAMQHEEADG
ncbi:MAG: hypothetical protein LBQ02_02460 [Candidatus Nomurabacteria bacterium]|jgi:uncharacterized HAD superfamily protein|nr:hypothetical protein [Candidatus Nomurabacteria bacterium]